MNQDIDSAAVDWFGRVRLNDPSAMDLAAFKRWRAASPENAEAFTRVERLWQDLGDLQSLPESHALVDAAERDELAHSTVARPAFFRRNRLPLALAASVVGAGIVLASFWFSGERYETQIAEVRALNLPDGSRITLGAHSRIDVRFTEGERRLKLTGGEAFFEVQKDARRPFVVDAGETRVRVLGTKFEVHRGQERINVAVLEGTVEVDSSQTPDSKGTPRHILKAGQQITTGRSQPNATPEPTNPNTPPGAWRTGRLSYDNARLVEVIADVNRYYPAGITLGADELVDLKVTTAFSVGQIEPLLNSLTRALPISARRAPDGHVTLEPRRE